MELVGLAFLQIILLFCAVIAGTACTLIVYVGGSLLLLLDSW
jgi:hypothetical protein